MPGRFINSVLLIVLAGAACFGCANPRVLSPPSPDTSTAEALDLDEASEKRAEAFARFATGVTLELNDQPDEALDQFHKSALLDPSNEGLALELSRRYLQAKKPERAIELLSRSTRAPGSSGTLDALLAKAYLQTGETNLAISTGLKAIKKNPRSIIGYQVLNEVYLLSNQPAEALKALEQGFKQTKTDSFFQTTLAALFSDIYEKDSKTFPAAKTKALQLLGRVAKDNPKSPNLWHKMGDVYLSLDENTRAAGVFEKLLADFQPQPALRDSIREKLANLYLRSNDKTNATEQLEAIVRDNPTRFPQAYYLLGSLAFEAKNYDRAADYFNKALVLNPDIEQAYYDLAGMQMNQKKLNDALATLERARAKYPQSYVGEFFTGMAYSQLKDYSEALKHFTAAEILARAKDPKMLGHLFYYHLGATYERKGDFEESEKAFLKSIELNPNFTESLNYLGYMWADRGEKLEKALEFIQKAVSLEPKNAAFLDSLGWVLFKLGRAEEALESMLKAVSLSEEVDATLYDHLGEIYRALRQNEKAREAWKKSLEVEKNETVREKLKSLGDPGSN
jgi:tetratricopeptide (TPR) repeat protein